MTPLLLAAAAAGALSGPRSQATAESAARGAIWAKTLRSRLRAIERRHRGRIGVYVRNLETGHELSFRADERWYLASGVKVPIAIAVLRAIDERRLTLESTALLEPEDYVDGAGLTNWQRPGARLTVRFLLEQMIVHSDNTASDLLIKLVGLEQVNRVVAAGEHGFGRITRLGDVRRLAYAGIHERAARLKSADLLAIKAAGEGAARVNKFAQALALRPDELKTRDLDEAFRAYYSSGANSAPLRDYARLLERLNAGKLLSPASTRRLLGLLGRVETGRARIKAGLPPGVKFAHKTGTQHGRICDFGLATDERSPAGSRLVVAACVRDDETPEAAERALRELGQALVASGAFGG